MASEAEDSFTIDTMLVMRGLAQGIGKGSERPPAEPAFLPPLSDPALAALLLLPPVTVLTVSDADSRGQVHSKKRLRACAST